MAAATTAERTHHAWRHSNVAKSPCMYVQTISHSGRGDRYSYTTDAGKALPMTERQCRDFCAYMRQCDTVGFWN